MSRPVAGVRKKTIIVTLPGSPKGAKENLQSIFKLLPHACHQAAGVDSRKLHAGGVEKLEKEAGLSSGPAYQPHSHSHEKFHGHSHEHSYSHGHGHDHGHAMPIRHTHLDESLRSNDPALGPTRRNRSSPYQMVSVEEALKLIEEYTPPPSTTIALVNESIIGSVLAEDVTASEAVPAYRASIVDGYAVIAPEDGSSIKGIFPVASVSHAAPGSIPPLEAGQIARITTGAPLPPGANSVVMVEDTLLTTSTQDDKEEVEIEILAEGVEPGENVREIGSDIKKGEVILRKGDEISTIGGELGLLASVGKAEVLVYKRPVVGVLSTGDEIVEHNRPGSLCLGEVRDCNRPTLMAAVQNCGFEAVDLGIARDKPGDLEQNLRDAFQKVDVVITTGGVSMGELDLLKPTIERCLGGVIHFGRVSMKPGKPTTFATVSVPNNFGSTTGKVIFSLPGNPVSAIVAFHLFVLPSLHHASGFSPAGLPKILVTLGHDFRLDPQRAEYHRVIVASGQDGVIYANSTGGQRSSRVGSLKSANALLCLPAGKGILRKRAQVGALLMGKLGSEISF